MKRSELFFIFILLPLDIAMIIAAFVVAFYLRLNIESVPYTSTNGVFEYLKYSFYLMPLWIAIIALNGMYITSAARGLFGIFYKIFISNSVAILFLTLVIFFSKTSFFSRLILGFTWGLSILFVLFGRLILRAIQLKLLKYGIGVRNILLIGSGETANFVVSEIKKNPALGLKVAGTLVSDLDKPCELKKLGSLEDFAEVIKKNKIDEVIMTDSHLPKNKVISFIDYCGSNNIAFKFVPDIMSFVPLSVNNENIGSMPVLVVMSTPLDGWGRITKRVADFILALILIVVLSPIWIVISLLEKITSKGPVLYSHDRVGRDGKTFRLYKFRSMYLNAENKVKKFWTDNDEHDVRITPLGRFIRKTNLDELAQLWNILKGEMSFVGPRPEQLRWVEKFSHEIPDYIKRHRVKSGLTGWAQVNGLKGDTSIQERARYDNFYIENWSIWFDVKIIIKTFGIVLYEIFLGKFEYRDRA